MLNIYNYVITNMSKLWLHVANLVEHHVATYHIFNKCTIMTSS